MNNRFFTSLLFCSSLMAFSVSQAATYQYVKDWTGDQRHSGAPSPSCACDRDHNIADCPNVFESTENEEASCYDEYIPAGSQGWVYGRLFLKVSL